MAGGIPLTTFTKPTPLTEQIVFALRVLRDAREDGDAHQICVAAARLDRLLDRYAKATHGNNE